MSKKHSKYPHGQLMPINTDGQFAYIKGHVETEKAQSEIDIEFFKDYAVESIEHDYARWGFGYDDYGERSSWLYSGRDKSERGAFAVTTVNYKTI